jgi:hypothetical protein
MKITDAAETTSGSERNEAAQYASVWFGSGSSGTATHAYTEHSDGVDGPDELASAIGEGAG